ncbi:tyrosine recombinase XerC [Chitinimonas viridis]|uniref:Tyrosine recombinase XerC n=1 Tax=Chitinimonas viridis TaxID=664880 RepID=A0ABT8B9G4_9NEIS|nr:tyrosine recombinase XerC [Chitinimonas viridis]MDN3578670.1 tyrosine recombinase XerC [Chitinimonas viridis]
MTPLERLDRYLTGEQGKSPATRAAYLADARLLLSLAGDTAMENLTPREIRGFVRRMKSQGHDHRSIARRLSAWRGWFKLLVREAGFATNPVEGIKAPRAARKLPRPIGVDEAQGFLENLDEDDPLARRDRAMYELAYSAGLRVSELVGAGLADFRDEGRTLQVLGKGGKSRQVPVGDYARQALDNWLMDRASLVQPGETALFLNQRGRRMSTRAVQLRLAEWSTKLGLADRLHPHRLRHACASHFLQGSQDLRATQELLGHSSIATTQVYTRLDFQHLASVYDAAHPRAHTSDDEADN